MVGFRATPRDATGAFQIQPLDHHEERTGADYPAEGRGAVHQTRSAKPMRATGGFWPGSSAGCVRQPRPSAAGPERAKAGIALVSAEIFGGMTRSSHFRPSPGSTLFL